MKLTKAQQISLGVRGQGFPDGRQRRSAEERKRMEEGRKREEQKNRNERRAQRERKRAAEQRKKDEELKKRRKPFDRAMSRTKDGGYRRKEDGSYAVNTGRRFV